MPSTASYQNLAAPSSKTVVSTDIAMDETVPVLPVQEPTCVEDPLSVNQILEIPILSIDEFPAGSTKATPDDLALLMKMVSPAKDPLLSSTLESLPESGIKSSWHEITSEFVSREKQISHRNQKEEESH